MRSTGADHPVIVLKILSLYWSEEDESARDKRWSTGDLGGAGFYHAGLQPRGFKRKAGMSGMTGDCHVPFCGGLGVSSPGLPDLAIESYLIV